MEITPEERALFDQLTSALEAEGVNLTSEAELGDSAFGRLPVSPPESRLRPQREVTVGYVLNAVIVDSQPPIWRRFMVRSDASLAAVHAVLQAAFEWQDYHLYQFSFESAFTRGAETFISAAEFAENGEGTLAALTRLDETMQVPEDKLNYVYDYGDNWDLVLTLEEVVALEVVAPGDSPFATLLSGSRAAPPEDCGGIRDEQGLQQIVQEPGAFDFEAVHRAVGAVNPTGDFDPIGSSLGVGMDEPELSPAAYSVIDRIDVIGRCIAGADLPTRHEILTRVAKLCQEAVGLTTAELTADLGLITWALEHLDGVKLTQAGYLPPKYVRELVSRMNSPFMRETGILTEVNFLEVAELRQSLIKFGLLRKYRGELRRTKVGTAALKSPEAMIQTLARVLAPKNDTTFEDQARTFFLLCAATSDGEPYLEVAARLLTASGWQHVDGSPIEYHEVAHAESSPAAFLWFIGPQPRRVRHVKELSATAVSLARASLLAE